MSRKTELFLKLEDFFWRQHLSAEALPYGIKGSGTYSFCWPSLL